MKVRILNGCTGCGLCHSINSDVFGMADTAYVRQNKVKGNEQDCIEASLNCPVGVIQVTDI